MPATQLSKLLWREPELLELLVFKLETKQLLLTAGRTRWVQHATTEVAAVLEQLHEVDLARAVTSAELAESWGLAEDARLSDFATRAAPDGPWGQIFTSHLSAIVELTGQVKAARDAASQLLATASMSAQESLANFTSTAGTYDARGQAGPRSPGAPSRLFEASL